VRERPRCGDNEEAREERARVVKVLQEVVEDDRVERAMDAIEALLRSTDDGLVVPLGRPGGRRRVELDPGDPRRARVTQRPAGAAFAAPHVQHPSERPRQARDEIGAFLCVVPLGLDGGRR